MTRPPIHEIPDSPHASFDPDALNFPDHPNDIVFAKWPGTEKNTYLHLGLLKDRDTFFYHGREFTVRARPGQPHQVKPTGNVISTVNAVWSEHHDSQIHLTLHYPQTGETARIVTTHEHPFYIPSTESWIPAAGLTVGMDLQTCDGTLSEVMSWEEIDEPFTAYNIEVAHAHNYYVADPDNPNAPPVLVHNDCFKFKKFEFLHSRDTIISDNKSSYDFWSK